MKTSDEQIIKTWAINNESMISMSAAMFIAVLCTYSFFETDSFGRRHGYLLPIYAAIAGKILDSSKIAQKL